MLKSSKMTLKTRKRFFLDFLLIDNQGNFNFITD